MGSHKLKLIFTMWWKLFRAELLLAQKHILMKFWETLIREIWLKKQARCVLGLGWKGLRDEKFKLFAP